MPKVGAFWEGYRSDEFVLVIDGSETPVTSVTKISGLSEGEFDTVEQPDGGTSHVYKLAGTKLKYEPLTIERRVDGSPEDIRFRDWFRETFKLDRKTQGSSAVRKNGMIIKRHNGADVLTFSFRDAWVKSSKFSDLEAGSNNFFIQTIVLEHEGLQREG